MRPLVRLRTRPSRDGKTFKYFLDYKDENGRRRQISLRHSDRRKAQRQRDQKERKLRMGFVEPESMKLSDFLKDSLQRSRKQVRESTLYQARIAMQHFIKVIGDVDYLRVQHEHAESFVQAWLDAGNTRATVAKKLRHLKRLFQLAVYRGQLDVNPMRYVKQPRSPQQKIRVFGKEECVHLIEAAVEYHRLQSSRKRAYPIEWQLLIRSALCTGIRRGELLNTTWQDIDFERKNIDVAPKQDTKETWEWHIKDTDRRTLPLTDKLVDLFADYQTRQPERYPYVFIPCARYDYIQELRKQGKWSVQRGCDPLNNFDHQFRAILQRARVAGATFHDLRRTCLTNWLANGLGEYEVMHMAGHASFETTHRFYLAVRDDLLERTRIASSRAMEGISVAHLLRTPSKCQDAENHDL